MYKIIFLISLFLTPLFFSGCFKMPEEKVGIEPIFIKDSSELKDIPDFKKISETKTSTGKNISEENGTGKIISDEKSDEKILTSTGKISDEKTGTGENLENSSTGETTSEKNNLTLEGESEIISENNKTESGTNTEKSTSTGEIISEKTGSGENLEKGVEKSKNIDLSNNKKINYKSKKYGINFQYPIGLKISESENLISITKGGEYPKINIFVYKTTDINSKIKEAVNNTCEIKKVIKISDIKKGIYLKPTDKALEEFTKNNEIGTPPCFLNFNKELFYFESKGILVYIKLGQESQFGNNIDKEITDSITINN